MSRVLRITVLLSFLLLPGHAWAQIDFAKTGYYFALGDSVAAGEGAMPVTTGYVYQLYDHGVFGSKQQLDFANIVFVVREAGMCAITRSHRFCARIRGRRS